MWKTRPESFSRHYWRTLAAREPAGTGSGGRPGFLTAAPPSRRGWGWAGPGKSVSSSLPWLPPQLRSGSLLSSTRQGPSCGLGRVAPSEPLSQQVSAGQRETPPLSTPQTAFCEPTLFYISRVLLSLGTLTGVKRHDIRTTLKIVAELWIWRCTVLLFSTACILKVQSQCLIVVPLQMLKIFSLFLLLMFLKHAAWYPSEMPAPWSTLLTLDNAVTMYSVWAPDTH